MGDLDREAKMRETDFLSIPGKEATLDFLRDELGSWQPEALERLRTSLQTGRFDLTQEVLDIIEGVIGTEEPSPYAHLSGRGRARREMADKIQAGREARGE